MLTAGSVVYYGLDGVCCVAGRVEKKFEGINSLYFELHPYYRQNDTIYLPADNETLLNRLRPLVSRDDISRILEQCREKKCLWAEPEPLRREAFKNVLKGGDPAELIHLIRTLYDRKEELNILGKKLRTSDAAFLKDAERLLHEEFAYVLEITPGEVPAYIEAHLPR